MDIEHALKESGFRANEVRVYLFLLSQGLASPPQIASGTRIARPNCYKLLLSLKEKGLLTEQHKGKRRVYAPADPAALIHAMKLRTEAMEQLLPDLRALFTHQKNKPSIRFFDGPEQVKQLYLRILDAESIFGVASTKSVFQQLDPLFFKHLLKKMKEKHIIFHDILTEESVAASRRAGIPLDRPLYSYRLLPKSMGDIPVDILIWRKNVAFISVEPPIFGTLIEHEAIAAMLRVLFELSWRQLPTQLRHLPPHDDSVRIV